MKKTAGDSKRIINKSNLSESRKTHKTGNLIPAIIQDNDSKEVLMLAYMNRESFIRSLETGYTWFYSRERDCLWNKGETSGNFQKIIKIFTDCDNDALVFLVEQKGAACHTGNKSCFFNEVQSGGTGDFKSLSDKLNYGNYLGIYDICGEDRVNSLLFLDDLFGIVSKRIKEKSEKSYTYKLHMRGMEEILKKVGEESIEVILASAVQDKKQLIYEIADLLYHLTVLIFEKKISYKDIMDELKSRHK